MAEPAVSKRRNTLAWGLILAPSVFITAAVVVPFLILAHNNFSLSFISALAGNSPTAVLTKKALYNSLSQGGASSILSFAAGLPLGIFLGRYSFPLKKALTSFAIIPFFLPTIVVVFAFLTGFGADSHLFSPFPFASYLSSGFTGIVAVNVFFNAPLVALFVMTTVENLDPSLNEAAMTLGSGAIGRFAGIWGRDGLLAASGAAVLAFTYSFAGFAAPLIIGGPGYFTMDAWVYFMLKTVGNFPAAVFLALVEVIVLMVPAMVYVYISSKTRRVKGTAGMSPRKETRGLYFYLGTAYASLWVLGEAYLLSSVFLASLNHGTSDFARLFSGTTTAAMGISAGGAILNTVFYGIATSALVVSLGLMWVSGKRRISRPGRSLGEPMQYIPLIISSIILAFAISSVIGAITPEKLLWVIIVIAQSSVAIPVVLRVLDGGFGSIPSSYTEAALSLKGSPFFEVELPLAKNTFAAAILFGFAISLGEFSATNFIATSPYFTLTVLMYNLQNARLFGASYAVAAILLLISLISFYIIQKLGERFIALR